MTINGRRILLEKVDGSGNMYSCPECTTVEGKASTIYAHFVQTHLDIIHRDDHEETEERPYKKPRTDPIPSPPSSSPSPSLRPPLSQVQSSQGQNSQPRSSQAGKVHGGSSNRSTTTASRSCSQPSAATSAPRSTTKTAPSLSSSAPHTTSTKPSPFIVAPRTTMTTHPSSSALPPATAAAKKGTPIVPDEVKKLSDNVMVTGLRLVGEAIFAGYETKDAIFAYLAEVMENLVNTCPVHHFLRPTERECVHAAFLCTELIAMPGSYFKGAFKLALNCNGQVTCVKCFTPTGTSVEDFNHPVSCKKLNQEQPE
ncbi:hypothetical protein PM082_012669 [Marasmius tenuissimus]|nr:hypothetical protein PM082_012669 [Marasmius tenuissimus]